MSPKPFRLDPTNRAFAVIILDCIFTLNQQNLTREEYLREWQKMVRKRMNQDISIEQLEVLVTQLGEQK